LYRRPPQPPDELDELVGKPPFLPSHQPAAGRRSCYTSRDTDFRMTCR
jgi:hypothetical protein